MSIEGNIQRAVQLACYGNQDGAMKLLQPLGLTDAQNQKVVALFQEAKPSSDALDLQKRVIFILKEVGMESSCNVAESLTPVAGAVDNFLLQFPLDIRRTTLFNLSMREIITCTSVCKDLNQIVHDDAICREIFCRDFQADYPKPASGFFRACSDIYRAQLNFQNGVYAKRHLECESGLRVIGKSEMFYSCSVDGKISIWDLEVKNCSKIIQRHPNGSRALIFDNGTFYSGCHNGAIEILDLEKGEGLLSLKGHQIQGQDNFVSSLRFADGMLCSGSVDASVKIWDLKTNKCLNTLTGDEDREKRGAIRALAFCDGLIYSGTASGTIKIWKQETGECLHTINAHSNIISGLIFHKEVLYSSSYDGLIKAWNPVNGELLKTYQVGKGSIFSFIILNGNLCSASSGGYIDIIDREMKDFLHTFEFSGGLTSGIAGFNGKLCAAAFADKKIHIWDFMEKDAVIFQELAVLFRGCYGKTYTEATETYKEATERFAKMPIKAKNKIYELCGIPASSDDREQQWANKAAEEKADAIERYIKSQEEDNTP